MAIQRITGQMLFSNLERQGVDLAIDGNLVYASVGNRRVGINNPTPQYSLDSPGNVKLANLIILGNTISSNSGVIGLGSISNISITGGSNYDVVYTDGSGTLKFGNLNYLSGLDGFTGNNIALGTNTQGSLSNALSLSTTISVTDAIADLNQLLGTITNSTGSILTTGTLTVSNSASVIGNLTVGGNILVATGNITTLNSAFFVGNTITGFNALYAGIPSGYSILPQVVAQFSENYNGYAQINTQNINAGGDATTDYVATANNGTDTTYYVDLGIAGSGYDPNSPYNSLGNVMYPNDAYLYAQGNTSANIGGNLVIGTTVHGRNLVIITGGINTDHNAATFFHSGTESANTASGTFVVYGGAGVQANLNVGGNLVVPTAYITTANVSAASFNTLSATSASISTATISGGSATGLTNVQSTTGVVTNFSSSNVVLTGGYINNLANVSATYATVTNFYSGNINGHINGTVDTANVGLYDSFTATSTNAVYYPQLVDKASGNGATYTTSTFTINPSTGNITVGNVIGNVFGTTATITGNVTATNLVGNLHADSITNINGNVITLSGTGSIKIPVGNTGNRPAGAVGYIRYNTDTNQIEYFNGTVWVPVTNTITDQQITGDGTNATFTLDQSSTTVGILVSINGTLQQPGTSYSVSGTQITFTEIPLVSDVIDVRFLGGTVNLNSTLADDLVVSGNITLSGILSAPQTTKASNAVGTVGQICWDANYIYVCTATNTWKRSPLTGGY